MLQRCCTLKPHLVAHNPTQGDLTFSGELFKTKSTNIQLESSRIIMLMC